jgi:hypothetical protein
MIGRLVLKAVGYQSLGLDIVRMLRFFTLAGLRLMESGWILTVEGCFVNFKLHDGVWIPSSWQNMRQLIRPQRLHQRDSHIRMIVKEMWLRSQAKVRQIRFLAEYSDLHMTYQ